MFYGSILFRFIGVIVIWFVKSLFSFRIMSFKYIWKGGKAAKSDDPINHVSSEMIQIFTGFLVIIIVGLLINGVIRWW